MKICFLTDDPNELGGGPEHIRQVAKILRQRYNYTVDVHTPLTVFPWFKIHDFFHRVLFVFSTLYFLISTNYDVYHSHTYSTCAFLPLVKLRGKKLGITVHGRGDKLFGGGLLNFTFIPQLLRWLILNVWPFDYKFSASSLAGFETVGNGVDIQKFSKIKKVPHDKFTILCISRDDPVKGINILKKAIARIPGIKLNLVSGKRRTLADFAAADVYVLPSLSEGLPIVILEAMAAKLPIITTAVGDCKKIVEAANCGLVVKPGDVNQLKVTIRKMIVAKDRDKMGERGKDYVSKNYSWAKVAALYNSSYRRASS